MSAIVPLGISNINLNPNFLSLELDKNLPSLNGFSDKGFNSYLSKESPVQKGIFGGIFGQQKLSNNHNMNSNKADAFKTQEVDDDVYKERVKAVAIEYEAAFFRNQFGNIMNMASSSEDKSFAENLWGNQFIDALVKKMHTSGEHSMGIIAQNIYNKLMAKKYSISNIKLNSGKEVVR